MLSQNECIEIAKENFGKYLKGFYDNHYRSDLLPDILKEAKKFNPNPACNLCLGTGIDDYGRAPRLCPCNSENR